jgi:hypothetical protein
MRRPDWQQRLSAAIVASRGRSLEYGAHDCCLFAADCILAVTGRDVAAAWRGGYATAAAGLRLAGVRSLAELADRILEPIAPVFARRGDVAVADMGDGVGLALCVVDHAMLCGACGTTAPRSAAVRAWRVD